MVDARIIGQIQKAKAMILAHEIYSLLAEDDTSAEIVELIEEKTTDMEVVRLTMELLERMDKVNEDPGTEAAEEALVASEEEYYRELGDSEG